MENVQKTYSDFHKVANTGHLYPTEWVIRTILGKYPHLNLDKTKYPGARILDLGFGDCRNMPLLSRCNFQISGVEISEEIITMAQEKLDRLGVQADLRVGTNANIPFEDGYFDYLLACHSCYYVDAGTSFSQNLAEIARVTKSGGVFLASLPAPGNFILHEAIRKEDGHVVITNDIHNIRNGYVFRTFEDEEEVTKVFAPYFRNIVVCKCMENYWGVQINFFLIAGERI